MTEWLTHCMVKRWLPWWFSGKESACQCRSFRFNPWVSKIPWRRKWQPTPVFLPWKSHGQRSPVGFGPWSQKESDVVNWWSTGTWAWLLKEIVISPGDTEKSTGIIPESPGQLNEFILQDKLWVCVWNECVFVRQHVWGSVFVRSEGVCAWVCEWLNSAWERVEHECVSVCVCARECTWVCVWESVGWWEYVCECDHMSVCECVWEGVFLCESECMCLHLALEVPVIVVPCRCNKMSCMQWLETTQTYYLLFLKVNDLKSRCSFWRLWEGGAPPLAFSSLQRPPPFLQPFLYLQSQQWQAGSFSQQIPWPVLPPLFYF